MARLASAKAARLLGNNPLRSTCDDRSMESPRSARHDIAGHASTLALQGGRVSEVEIQSGRVLISVEEARAREHAGEPKLSTVDRWQDFDASLVRSGDSLQENKGLWIHLRSLDSEGEA